MCFTHVFFPSPTRQGKRSCDDSLCLLFPVLFSNRLSHNTALVESAVREAGYLWYKRGITVYVLEIVPVPTKSINDSKPDVLVGCVVNDNFFFSGTPGLPGSGDSPTLSHRPLPVLPRTPPLNIESCFDGISHVTSSVVPWYRGRGHTPASFFYQTSLVYPKYSETWPSSLL